MDFEDSVDYGDVSSFNFKYNDSTLMGSSVGFVKNNKSPLWNAGSIEPLYKFNIAKVINLVRS